MNLNKSWLKKHEKDMADEAVSELGEEDGKDNLISNTLDETIESVEFSDGRLLIDFSSDAGWFSVTLDVDNQLAFQIVEYLKAQGKEIKRLINLAD